MRNEAVSETGQELFLRFSEEHFQRGYTLDEMKRLLKESKLEFVKAYDADTLLEVTDTSERIYCIAKENGK